VSVELITHNLTFSTVCVISSRLWIFTPHPLPLTPYVQSLAALFLNRIGCRFVFGLCSQSFNDGAECLGELAGAAVAMDGVFLQRTIQDFLNGRRQIVANRR